MAERSEFTGWLPFGDSRGPQREGKLDATQGSGRCQGQFARGIGRVHRIRLSGLSCMSPKRLAELADRLRAGRRLLRGQGRRLLARVDRLDFHAAIEFITRIILSSADQVLPRPNPSGNCPLLEGWLVLFHAGLHIFSAQ